MHRPAAILFDWDGTLVNSMPFVLEANNHVRKIFGDPPWSMEEFELAAAVGPANKIFAEAYPDRADEAYTLFYAYIEEHHMKRVTVLDGAERLLVRISEENIPCGVISNKKHVYLDKEINALGWNKYFQSWVGAGVAEGDKPHPAHAALLLERLGISSSKDVWLVGDNLADMHGAINADLQGILITHGKISPAAELAAQFFSSLNELYDAVFTL